MFCPKCSQSQSSDEMKFCSRCGFPLIGVSLLLNNDGTLPQLRNASACAKSTRARVATESLILMVFSWLIGLGTTFWFDAGGITEAIAKSAGAVFLSVGLIGLIRFLYAFLFLHSQQAIDVAAEKAPIPTAASTAALPEGRYNPINDWQRPVDTRQMATHSSVTENTTNLLDGK